MPVIDIGSDLVFSDVMMLIPESGVAPIVSDDLDDGYDLTGQGYSNYKP